MKKLKQGILISIEGIDGSGKSTLANKLRDKLLEKDLDVLLTYEPGDSALGKQLRKILHERDYDICGKAEYFLFASDRAQHFQEVIIPNLDKNKLIISDRMGDSSVAYQGYGRQEDVEKIKEINRWAMQDINPDIIFYIKVPLELALQRLKKRKSKPTSFEKEKEKFTKRLITGFEETFKNKKNVITLDGAQPADILTKIAYANVKQFIKDQDLTQV
ncbi:dTMP kinase [Candidatus Dependentiae bacterium]